MVKLSRDFESADIDVKCYMYHMIRTVVNPFLCANMVCMSDSALVVRLPLNQPSMLLSVYLNATGAFIKVGVFCSKYCYSLECLL